MKEIPLSKGRVALIDDDDFLKVAAFKWHVNAADYAVTNHTVNGKRSPLLMHRLILNAPNGSDVDHKDRNPLNNQKTNLRLCSRGQNMMNRGKYKGSSRYKGVHINVMNRGKNKYYKSLIKINGRQFGKLFPYTQEGELAAARHYDQQALKYFGDFARVNNV